MRRLCVLCSLVGLLCLLSSVAQAAEADMAALFDMKGRYVIGPWSGYEMKDTCYLANTEPLAGADFVISGARGEGPVQFRLAGRPAVVSEGLEGIARLSYFTLDGHTYDMHGFSKALALFTSCRAAALADTLPDEPVDESDPVQVEGTNWSVVTLVIQDYVYAKLASTETESPIQLGVWRYGNDRYVLAVTSVRGGNGPRVTDGSAVLQIDSGSALSLPYFSQEGGALVPLTPEALTALKAGHTLHAKVAGLDAEWDISGMPAVLAALARD